MRVRKVITGVVIGVVVLAVVVVAAVFLTINHLAKGAVERGGQYALGVPTTVDSVSVSLVGGSMDMNALNIANPAGYRSPHLMHTGQFDVAVRPGSLLSETVEVPRFELAGLDIHIEPKGLKSNIGEVLDHIEQLGRATEQPAQEAGGGKKVRLDRVVIRDVTATVHVPLAGAAPIVVKVPLIELRNVGSDQPAGATVGAIVAQLVPAILAAVLEAGQGVIPADLLAGLEGQLGRTMAAMGDQAQRLIEQAGAEAARRAAAYSAQAGQVVGAAAQKAQEAVGEAGRKAQSAIEQALQKAQRAVEKPAETPAETGER